ncbi:MAG: 50S ribosomal protein L9 [Gammaproteobacteria bacterium]|nr:50S ribosomal protein L9 [Gammaproteobacteria bacterium]NIV06270.1 50S ribosomal protein L9 [candidate division Zixibacteria bacterium]NIY20366.1 50S ribosomal protein L9 [Gammaproteobacteria bacterium]
MKVLLLEDVYNLGRAGEVKKVANGYGRNYLIPQGLATLATPGALAQAERIQKEADYQRSLLNKEMSQVAEKLEEIRLVFPARAGETGKLYGSVTTQMIAESLTEELGTEINKRQIDSQPLRLLGMHKVKVRLTIDLIPEFDVVVYREGETPENYMVDAEELVAETTEEQEDSEITAAPEAAVEEAVAEETVVEEVQESAEAEEIVEQETEETAE